MANKTARILRTLPLEGVMYRANDLVIFTDAELKLIDEGAYDATKEAVDYCASEGIKPVKLGVDPRAKKPAEANPAPADDDTGELSE